MGYFKSWEGNGMKDLGIMANVTETRTAAVCKNNAGREKLVIAAKGFLAVVDPENDSSSQVRFPSGINEYPYICFADSNGYFYTGSGNAFIVFDPFENVIIDIQLPLPQEEAVVFALAEGRNGEIFTCTYPSLFLLEYRPNTQSFHNHGKLDETEKYAGTIAVDDLGWVYIGIGTENNDIKAYHPPSKKKKSLLQERGRGTGYVHLGKDGNVYAQIISGNLRKPSPHEQWFQLKGGQLYSIDKKVVVPSHYSGEGFQVCHQALSNFEISSLDLTTKEVLLCCKKTNLKKNIPIDYDSEGAQLSILTQGPNGLLYGTSMHPLHFYQYDPSKDEKENFGSVAIQEGGGGNIGAFATQNRTMIGAAYAGGKVHKFDFTEPFEFYSDKKRNPQLVCSHESIHRPRTAISHPDQEHIVIGGYPGYGMVGGGLGIFNTRMNKMTLISHERTLPYHSTISLAVKKNGDLIGGTSILTPGGGTRRAIEAKLYVMDWSSRQVLKEEVPVKGAEAIVDITVDQYNRIHGITSDGIYFVNDSNIENALVTEDLSNLGLPVRKSFIDNENTLYCLLTHAIIRINKLSGDIRVIHPTEHTITSGGVLVNMKLYFTVGSHLFSFQLNKGGAEESEL
ncbi:hypothetical protein [Pseudalkalibacillus salsuginis]|uniref:hypothetical protein n=1 Tax=Pseudalkalibacillus salsuginis TaxID=2910972 RepID=UPI001F461988|nr:hypothetical protein [Pseudalkalibacillus salsuginis]MCF6409977.1 hypothetical protein [Pseudalkalibacillus salsuginis]